ncbi:FAD:protein FMN transferase [Kushneria aurantia]|uniref:FAD:protein FMN transferase n=1 Tax=Kushneria aurantia TaxID=504092 RepID=A0ABV6G7U5_9GAMM|nr:FAD:protein FMN transferase [Kushneria aurantia]
MLRTLTLLLVLPLAIAGCDRSPERVTIEGQAQGTSYHISWWRDGGNQLPAVRADVSRTLTAIDRELSTYRDDSWISQFNASRSTDWQPAPESALHLLAIARQINARSDGCYDPTISPLFRLWGFQEHDFRVPTQAEITTALADIGLQHLDIDPETGRIRKEIATLSLDLSSMGEGYSVDRLAADLEARGIHNYLVELGGDMRIRGSKPDGTRWRVGIEAPTSGERRPGTIATIEDVEGISINTSGTYRRYFDDNGQVYSHILDPRSGRPAEHNLVSSTVFGHEAARSDGWATALLCLGPAEGMATAEREGLAALLIQRPGEDQFESDESPALESSERLRLQRQGDQHQDT